MQTHLVKKHWLDCAIEIREFHVSKCRDNPAWTIEKTAELLNRSTGNVSQSIKLASWAKTHDKQLRRFKGMKDALAFVKQKEHEMRLQ